MASQLPSTTLRRACISSKPQCCTQQTRSASLIPRPHRPYTFTQLITLSDGSSFLTRSTSPQAVYRSTKDTRNHPLWQPSLDSLRNVEMDEAGRLRAFRNRFGRGWDVEENEDQKSNKEGRGGKGIDGGKGEGEEVEGQGGREEEEGSLMDLISGTESEAAKAVRLAREEKKAALDGKAGEVEDVKMVTVLQDGKLVKVPVVKKTYGAKGEKDK